MPMKVLDFTRYMPGPLASRVLVDLGADVIKIENTTTGDANRGFAPFINGEGLFHVALNAGTRSLAIDRRSPHWDRVISACVKWADAVLVAGASDSLVRMGLNADKLIAENPRLVYCSITGYGEDGPWRALPAHGLNPDAFAGIVPVERYGEFPQPHEKYQSAGAPLAGLFAALGILGALRRRDETGEPQRITVSLLGAAIWWNWRHVTSFANLGEEWWSYKNFGGRYGTYDTSDGRQILVCPLEKNFWEAFCDLLDMPPDWRSRGSWGTSSMDHGTKYPWERAEIAKKIVQKPFDHWIAEFTRIKIPFAPMLTLKETLGSEHVAANAMLRDVWAGGKEATIPAFPVEARNARGDRIEGERPKTPGLGEHNAAILKSVGLAELADTPLTSPR